MSYSQRWAIIEEQPHSLPLSCFDPKVTGSLLTRLLDTSINTFFSVMHFFNLRGKVCTFITNFFSCFTFTSLKQSKNFNVTIKAHTIRNTFTPLFAVYYRKYLLQLKLVTPIQHVK